MAAGVVYLRTNRFEVKLQGITFKKKIFENLCKIDFLFPDGKTWDDPPVVGLDVMCHPRDPSIILLLLSFGVGCLILRFGAGESLPAPIHRFLADKRIRFVGFGILEKTELFPFHELGLSKRQIDIGYIAARVFKDPKYKRYELGDLARKVVGIKRMVGLTESASFERHAQIKCAICQLFVTSLIAMGMLHRKRLQSPSKKPSFAKNLNSLQLLAEGWFKLPGSKNIPPDGTGADEADAEIRARMEDLLDAKHREDPFSDYFAEESPAYWSGGDNEKGNNSGDDKSSAGGGMQKPIKGILKCPSTTLNRSESCRSPVGALSTTLNRSESCRSPVGTLSPSPSQKLKRANSKGCNVRFNFQ
ncbi:hypothetical protein SASPL_124059 [Salvia splendens]|uniref:Werner syndrome ATP-dependent helicase n=1 Tax=Salvia splendens TaxID=180675 RepID=A0A8X8XSC1_SALSN|nr:uncharacterized protein LOC121744144 [Salvia splendens]KAG6416626.1 hypothetical protein SASPL_124059 [Salvia splendens]